MPKRKVENKTIEVILLQNDKHLGEKFEIVRVKPIFVRNILLPQNIAVLADEMNKNKFAQKMKAAEADRQKKASGLDELFTKLHEAGGITIIRKANEDNTLYAKVDENDIVAQIKDAHGVELEPHHLKLKKKITALGNFVVPFLYKELKKEIAVKVEQDPEEAEKLAKKKSSKTAKAEPEEEAKIKKTREEIMAEKEEARKVKKEETLKRLKEKFKD